MDEGKPLVDGSGEGVTAVPYKFKVHIYEDIPRVLNDNLRARGACKAGRCRLNR